MFIYLTFKDYVCIVTGLSNYCLAYAALASLIKENAYSILYDALKYIRPLYETGEEKFKTLGDRLRFWASTKIPWQVYQNAYLLKDSETRDFVKRYCEPLKDFQNDFKPFEQDFLDGKCTLKINSSNGNIQEVTLIYDRAYLGRKKKPKKTVS